MNITPSLEKLKELAADGRYTVAPLSCELLADFTTPIEALRVLQAVSDHCFLLESARADETWGRYTFLGFEPKRSISCVNGELTDGGFPKPALPGASALRGRPDGLLVLRLPGLQRADCAESH